MSHEVTHLLGRLGVDVNVAAPMGATPADLARLGEADFNVVLYPEIAGQAAAVAAAHVRPADREGDPDRRRRHHRLRPRGRGAGGGRSRAGAGARRRRGCPGIRARSIPTI